MAKAMKIVDVFKALLDGGHIVSKTPAVTGKSEYKVMIPGEYENAPDKCVGHITEKQFETLYGKGLLDVSGRATQDKYNNIYTSFCLATKTPRGANTGV